MPIRVPNEQYDFGEVSPEQAQVPTAKQPVANANDFGAAQAQAGEQAGQKVQGAAVDVADRIIQQKMWTQQSEIYENKENVRDYADNLINDTGTHTVKDPDGSERQVPNGLGLRTGQDAVGVSQEYQQKMQSFIDSQKPDGLLNSLNKTWQRNVGSIYSLGYGKMTSYESAQAKQTIIDHDTVAVSNVLKNADDYGTYHEAAAAVHEIGAHLWAASGIAPKDWPDKQNDLAYQTGVSFYTSKISSGQMTREQALKDLNTSTSDGGVNKVLDDESKAKLVDTINKSYDSFQTEQKKQEAIQVAQNTNEAASKVGSGIIDAHNANSLFTMGIDPKLAEPLYNALMKVSSQRLEGTKIDTSGMNDQEKGAVASTQKEVPMEEGSFGELPKGESRDEFKDARNYALGILNSQTHQDASDMLSKWAMDPKLDRVQLQVATRALALVGQFAPTRESAAQGQTVDPAGAEQIGGAKFMVNFSKNLDVAVAPLMKQYLDNNNNKMSVSDNIASVKGKTINEKYPSTVETGVPNQVVSPDGKTKFFHMDQWSKISPKYVHDIINSGAKKENE